MAETLNDIATQLAELSARVAELSAQVATQAPDMAHEAADAALHGGASPFIYLFSAFILACFVGYYVVWSVTPALHTPLMSVTNAVSSVIVVGALIAVGVDLDIASGWTRVFGFIATVLAAVNIFGGFLVTERMLAMYKKKG
ncbi:proton-translocating transhydrogenase family protein [Oceanicella sp. SM1341]|uniref:proton-translocating transhydrogenase family protein n=1 Tax=Oceanicella sp. SM1341 TaxID=1548889 RepID=UPI000E53D737|nr:proton-translocating transhydrogenase family protein [Oceanicella sp. SM1341]